MMKNIKRIIARKVLALLVKKTIRKHKIKIYFVAGNGRIGQLREILYTVLKLKLPTRRNTETPDTEFYIPLFVMGINEYPQSFVRWIYIILKAFFGLIIKNRYEHQLVVEISYINSDIYSFWLKTINPDIVFITNDKTKKNQVFKVGNSKHLFLTDKDILNKIALSKCISKILKINEKEVSDEVEKAEVPMPRINILNIGKKEVIDDSYIYKPVPFKSIEEMYENYKGIKIVVSDFKSDYQSKPNGWIFKNTYKNEKFDLLVLRLHKPKQEKILNILYGTYQSN